MAITVETPYFSRGPKGSSSRGDAFIHELFTSSNTDTDHRAWIDTLERLTSLPVRTPVGARGEIISMHGCCWPSRPFDCCRRALYRMLPGTQQLTLRARGITHDGPPSMALPASTGDLSSGVPGLHQRGLSRRRTMVVAEDFGWRWMVECDHLIADPAGGGVRARLHHRQSEILHPLNPWRHERIRIDGDGFEIQRLSVTLGGSHCEDWYHRRPRHDDPPLETRS
jgi:hypothetical protein